MASQDSYSIPLNFSHSQEPFRLLELPPELLNLLTSANAPVLSLKSSPASSSTTSGSAPAFAVLTTHNQTFQLRQVQSSNSIFLVQPSGISNAGADTICTPPSLSIVSQSKATLELSQVSANPVPYLEKLLPLYNGPHEDEDASPLTAPPGIIMNRRSKRSVFEDIPASDDEVEKGWRDMCAFENNGQALRPSVVYLVELWQAIMSVATAQGIDMTERFQFSDLWEMLEVDGWPESLIDAVLQILSKVDNTPKDGWMLLDRDKSIRWIGANMLKAQGQVSIPISEFEDAWKNELPEQWGMSAKLDVLEGLYKHPTSTTIRFTVEESGSKQSTASLARTSSSSSKTTRKWHERFKNTRQ